MKAKSKSKLVSLVLSVALCVSVAIMCRNVAAQASESESAELSLLFVQNASGFAYDKTANTLTLQGVYPTVIFFADRPDRVAGHLVLTAFLQLWNEGSDSFKSDPPNANLSVFLDDNQVGAAVIEIAEPRLKNDQLTYKVISVLEGDLPASGGVTSLFIDGFWSGGAKGAASGAIIGALAGDAGKGAAIGAAVGVVGGSIRQHQENKAKAAAASQAQANTRVVNVPNSNGSFTPVSVVMTPDGWRGPNGEIYPSLPTADQLKPVYGLK